MMLVLGRLHLNNICTYYSILLLYYLHYPCLVLQDLTTSDLKRSVYIVCKIFREG